jgi:hypothetical protein
VSALQSPFIVPPFDPGKHGPKLKYVWWSWHPNYPYWSKSCWDGDSVEDAWKVREDRHACGLNSYHNKLIQEGDGALTEVADDPCREMDVWRRIAARNSLEHAAFRQVP